MKVAGLLRGVRPIGDWSISTTLSIWLAPRRLAKGPGLGAMPPSRRTSARASVSSTSELLPDPLTPVTHTSGRERESGGDVLEVVGRLRPRW